MMILCVWGGSVLWRETHRKREGKKESEWVSVWLSEWLSEWVSEWVSEWKREVGRQAKTETERQTKRGRGRQRENEGMVTKGIDLADYTRKKGAMKSIIKGKWIQKVWLVHRGKKFDRNTTLPSLTYWDQDKTTHICRRHFKTRFLEKQRCILIQMSLKYIPYGSINNTPAMAHIITLCGSGEKTDMNNSTHYIDVITGAMASQITGVSVVCLTVCSGAEKEHIKALRHLPMWGEFIGNRWTSLTKGQ